VRSNGTMRTTLLLRFVLVLLAAGASGPERALAQAANVLVVTSVVLDPPTLHMLGVQMLIGGDQNRNAQVAVRYRTAGSPEWRAGLPLFRVLPETVTQVVPEQFAGTIFDLGPDTAYEIELHATDPDGPVDELRLLSGRTRPVPRANPATPSPVTVTSAGTLQSALSSAVPGRVITLANGLYAGAFSLSASGTAANPIVIRGQSAAGAILDGQNCGGCNVLEVSGSYVHVENLTIRNAVRAVRFLGAGTRNNVARRLTITDVVHGIAQGTDQRDFYIADNVIDGRLFWPWVFDADASSHWDDRGVAVHGDGHVVCHNRIRGFGDPMISMKVLARAIDFYGNDILDTFDGTELDYGGGNVRAVHNRWTNVAAGISLQPVYGGPAYVLRNVLYNVVDEQIKLKSVGGTDEPSGALVYHNTFVSPYLALNLQTPITGHNFAVMNNLFVGPRTLAGPRTVEWTANVDRGEFDFDGYFPDGGFWLGRVGGVNQVFPNFAALQASGVFEGGGRLLTEPIFAAGFVGPADGMVRQDPADFSLASASNAVDGGTALPGLNQWFQGGGPDLGALERGCPVPIYGPRPLGAERLAAAVDCRTDLIFRDGFES
jgi:chondroitinase B-like protein